MFTYGLRYEGWWKGLGWWFRFGIYLRTAIFMGNGLNNNQIRSNSIYTFDSSAWRISINRNVQEELP